MPTTDHDRASQVLRREDCLAMLRSVRIGRLAYTEAALPAIRPVSFSMRDDEVLIPALLGSPLVDAVRGTVVAFEADDYDGHARTGWSVTVVGPSRVVAAHRVEPQRTDLCLIAVQVGLVQGWRTTLPDPGPGA